jgi:hypothetical protein
MAGPKRRVVFTPMTLPADTLRIRSKIESSIDGVCMNCNKAMRPPVGLSNHRDC